MGWHSGRVNKKDFFQSGKKTSEKKCCAYLKKPVAQRMR